MLSAKSRQGPQPTRNRNQNRHPWIAAAVLAHHWQMEPGESWAYRARGIDPVVEVHVVRVGTQKPARVLVRFVDAEFEGKEDWVPPSRLKTLWEYVEGFRAREVRWDAVTSPGLPQDDPREEAAEIVFTELIDGELAHFGYFSQGGIVFIRDIDALAAFLCVDASQLSSHKDSFIEDGNLIAPWDVTELVVSTAARNDPAPILRYVDAEERTARNEAIHGRYARTSRGQESFFIEPEWCLENDEKRNKPARAILRSWCGADATDRFDELAELRKEIRRVGDVAQQAISLLEHTESKSAAARLRRELGTPVELLHAGDDESSG